ncbi:5-methyltetrahydropteroyltriglutamate--homocysteine methyltransferase [Kitasatospora brasiliensis]|uniref:5-methyltetrahydropteroyltriglutamate-- homocysteine methyltransferase n=1 Tax=Kitasatospora brasiliensis TaxID=3058040 RepID=UPI00292CA96B|nr:5-methyltetrahydropteroyltriglutamate--homocysteine methyltransferase [Kitasatospora sp. K002]
MSIPSELIGSVPRPQELLSATAGHAAGRIHDAEFAEIRQRAVQDTIARLESLGSPVVTDGDQAKPSAYTYPIAGADNLADDGFVIPFADGHIRTFPRLTSGPFRYRAHADQYLRSAQKSATVPVKQSVVAPSLLSLLYPADGISGYSRETFLDDLVAGAEADIRGCLDAGAHVVQLDFTEARLSLKLDPSGGLLRDLVALDNRVLERFSKAERARIGVHADPGADQGSTHSLDIDYAELLPELFKLAVGNFYLSMAGEAEPDRVLTVVAEQLPADARVFVGVIDPIDPVVETAEQVRDRVLAAARHLPADRLGTCDDSGFAPFADDVSTSRETAFAKIRARVEGTALAAEALGL